MQLKIKTFALVFLFMCVSTVIFGQNQADSANLSSPYHTIRTHLRFLEDDNLYKPSEAAKALPSNIVSAEKKAIRLKQILDGKGLRVSMSQLPRNENYGDTLATESIYVLFPKELPEVYLEKIDNQWLYSEETVNAIAKLHREVYPFGTDVLINLIPKGGQSEILGIKIWQIIGVLGLLIAVFLIHKITTHLFRLLLRRLLKTRAKAAILDPKLIFNIARLSSIILMFWILIRLLPILQFPVEIVSTVIIGLRIMRTVFAILLGFKLVDLLTLYVKRATDKTGNTLDNQIVPIIRQSLDIIIGVIGVIVILNYLKVNVTALIAGISIGGLALALAAQETVKNLIGSVMIFVDRPFQIGDYIVTKTASGTVEEVGFRSTRIRSAENSVLTIPNGTLANMVIDNFGLRIYRRYKTDLTLTYDTNPEKITAYVEGIKTIILEHPKTRKEGYQVHFNNLSASSLDILLIVYFQVTDWTEELESRQELLLEILKLAKELGIEFAYPTTSVHLVNTNKS